MSRTHIQSLGEGGGGGKKREVGIPFPPAKSSVAAQLVYVISNSEGERKKELRHVCTASGEYNGVRQIKWEKNYTDFGQQLCILASVCVSLCVCEDSAVTWSCWHNATSVLKECSGYPCIPAVKSQSLKLCVCVCLRQREGSTCSLYSQRERIITPSLLSSWYLHHGGLWFITWWLWCICLQTATLPSESL